VRTGRIAVAVLSACLGLAACGGSSTPLSQLSAHQILTRIANNVASAQASGDYCVQVATPSTTLEQCEDGRGGVSGNETSANGRFDAVLADGTHGLSVSYTARFVEMTAPSSARQNEASLRHAADALTGWWLSGALLKVDPSAERIASTSFTDSPSIDEEGLFSPLVTSAATVGAVTTFDHQKVVALHIGTNGEVLFVSDTSRTLPVGASVPLGSDTSPVIFTFSWAVPQVANPFYTAPGTVKNVCRIWRAAPSAHSVLLALAAPGTYDGC
jgi:hypothetical protein